MKTKLEMGMKLFVLILSLLVWACDDDDDSDGDTGGPDGDIDAPQCGASGYVAFDSANHQNQDIRVGIYTEMNELMSEAKSDYTLAEDRFTQAKALFTDLDGSANFREKVQGRGDDHLDGSPIQGDRLDATIIAWLDKGIAAESNLEANVAKQWVDKTFTEFFFLSVYHEMVAGTRSHWDEAFGYYGSKSDNDETNLEGLAVTAFKRDSTNGTNLRSEIFNDIIDGACELEKALAGAGIEEIDTSTVPALSALVDSVDINLQKVLAYSVGHEAFELQAVIDGGFDSSDAEDTDEIWIKMAELIPFFEPLGRIMDAKGGDSAARAAEIQAIIGGADFEDLSTIDWMNAFTVEKDGAHPAERIIELLEAEYGIEITG